MVKVGICGHFNSGSTPIGGQTIKTRIITEALQDNFSNEDIIILDTELWRKSKISFILKCIIFVLRVDNVIILPAKNGVRLLMPFFVTLSKVFKKKLHYIIVGAWLPNLLIEKTSLVKWCKNIDFIYAQTNTLINKLNDNGLDSNLYLMNNFKREIPLDHTHEVEQVFESNKVCMVSRINYKKGIESAVEVINKLNRKDNNNIQLDIYGPVEEDYERIFLKLVDEHKSFVTYRGVIDYNKISDVIKCYYILLFPTKYYTEGFPGTILDAYMAGVPVLASRWESWSDIIVEGETGYTFEFDNNTEFYEVLKYMMKNKNQIIDMKSKCILESQKYSLDNAIKVLLKNIS